MNGDYTKCISLAEVSAHTTKDDFWTVIDNVVYNMSGFVPTHPGGSMILLAAGTDCTIMFHQYHLIDNPVTQKLLKCRKIGIFDGQSPVIGPVYKELKRRIQDKLKHVPKQPPTAAALFFMDIMFVLCFLVWSIFTTTATPIWQLFSAHLVAPTLILRLFGQSHALGHVHIFPAKSVSLWGKLLLAAGAPGIGMFMIPASDRNPRSMLNEPRIKSQSEFAQHRGPGEHQSVHHVRGAELEHDECFQVATMFNTSHLAEHQAYWLHHGLQDFRVVQFLVAVFADLSLCVAVACTERVLALKSYFIPQGLWGDAAASSVGIVVCCCMAKTHLLLPLHGVNGLGLFIAANLIRYNCFCSMVELFFAQHIWDHKLLDSATADQDWAKHNAESSLSLRGLQWHPVCWGMGSACPSTLTYHLEHTLFPGVCYLHLPKIASIVEATLAEFGVQCNVIVGFEALRNHYQDILSKYAVRETDQ
jgi:fatty acid desaturase